MFSISLLWIAFPAHEMNLFQKEKQSDRCPASPEQKDNSPSFPDIAALIAQIQQYPELGKILSDVLAKQASTDENTENGNGNLSDSE